MINKDCLDEDISIVRSGHIPGALGIKTVIQLVELGITLTIVVFLGNAILNIISFGIFDSYNDILNYFVYLFGYGPTYGFAITLCALFVVMAGRWIMSWASNNGGQTPNNNGN